MTDGFALLTEYLRTGEETALDAYCDWCAENDREPAARAVRLLYRLAAAAAELAALLPRPEAAHDRR